MLPVIRKAARPMSWSNVRGVLSISAMPKAFSKVVRSALAPWLHLAADTVQHGAVKSGSSVFPMHMARTFSCPGQSQVGECGSPLL